MGALQSDVNPQPVAGTVERRTSGSTPVGPPDDLELQRSFKRSASSTASVTEPEAGSPSHGDRASNAGKKKSGAAMTATGLDYLAAEISFGSRWINLNDGETQLPDRRRHHEGLHCEDLAEGDQRTLLILGGSYLIHAVPDADRRRRSGSGSTAPARPT